MSAPTARPRALTIGLHPRSMDYGNHPQLTEKDLRARVDAANDALRDTEFDITTYLAGTSPEATETELRKLLAGQQFDLVMIGGAVRALPEHTLLFERIVNTVVEAAPGITFCFNTSPETTLDALRRVRPPA